MQGLSEADHYVLLFASIHDVMAAEHAAQGFGLWCDMIPTPRQLSSDCGMAIRIRAADWPTVGGEIARRKVVLRCAYRLNNGVYAPVAAANGTDA
jgi:hypothetical protein